MNDTTNAAHAVHTPLPQEIEGWDNPPTTPLPLKELGFLGDLMGLLTRHVETLVDQRFAALVESHRTLALMDENMKTAIAEMIDDRVCDHEDSHEHWTEDAIDSNIGAYLDGYMRNNSDYITENRVMEILRDTMSEEIDEIVERKLDGASISISL